MLGEGLEQALRLHDVGVYLATMGDGADALLDALLVDMHQQINIVLLGDAVAELDHFLELPRGVDVQERERDLGRIKCLAGQVHHHARVFADAVEHDRIVELGRDFANDVDALRFELTQVGELASADEGMGALVLGFFSRGGHGS